MKNYFLLLMLIAGFQVGFGQRFQHGESFDFDAKSEIDPAFVLADNYNTYLLTMESINGFNAGNRFTLRKFDQTNKLVDTHTYKMPQLDGGVLHNFLGWTESGNKLYVYTYTYSGKVKKGVIGRHEFDKTSGQFATTELASAPIQSNSKSGNAWAKKSDNGRFIGVVYNKHHAKDEVEKTLVIMLDAATQDVVWQKEFESKDENFLKDYAVTNSGKVVFLRTAKGFKRANHLVLASADGQEDKMLDPEIWMVNLKAVSIGSQDYILGFNQRAKGIRGGDFENLLLYDLQAGKTLQNPEIKEYRDNNIKEVDIVSVAMQNSEFHIFTEAKTEENIKPAPGATGMAAFPEKIYRFGPAHVIVLAFDGTLKAIKPLSVDQKARAELYHSYGLVNIKGNHWLNTGHHGGFFVLQPGTFDRGQSRISFGNDLTNEFKPIRYVNQLSRYFPDSNRMLFARIIEGQMNLVSVYDFN